MALQIVKEGPDGQNYEYWRVIPQGWAEIVGFKDQQARLDDKQPGVRQTVPLDIMGLPVPEGVTNLGDAIKKAIYLKLKESPIAGSMGEKIDFTNSQDV